MQLRLLHGLAAIGVLAVLVSACASSTSSDASTDLATTSAADSTTARAASASGAIIVEEADPVEDTAAQPLPTTTNTPPTTTTTTVPVRTAEECAAEIPLEIRVGQLMFPLITQSDLGVAANLAEAGRLGGVVVIGRPNAGIAAEIATMQDRSLLGPVIVAVDEEGGDVQRLAGLTAAQPSARSIADSKTAAEAKEIARLHAAAIGELGFTMNLAPVVDLDNGGFLGTRTFGRDPQLVTEFGLATADGILEAGLTPVIKHFPGHGRGTDSHTGLPTLPALEVLRDDDLLPFVTAASRGDLPIMIGHLVVPDLTDGKPATLSAAAIDGLLRTELGFDGLVMTDAFNMAAIAETTSNEVAAEQSLAAGADLVMLGSIASTDSTVDHVVAAVESGLISEASVTESFLRVLDERGLELCALPEAFRPKIGCQPPAGGCSAGG